MLCCWERFLKEGDILFNYMINNFEDMFDGDTIKHFDIKYQNIHDYGTIEIKTNYNIYIQLDLIIWIRNEINCNNLFNNNNWKPFRDNYHLTSMYLGYKYLFKFKQYYFQLIIESDCNYYNNCIYCININKNTIHFELVLYGWKDDDSSILKPYNRIVLYNNIMPEIDWKQK